jgi:hypothetical protein
MRFTASSEAELRAFLDSGAISESHHLEAKRMVAPGKGANLELARDLASLAVGGGVLLLGVDEDKQTGTFSLAPQPLRDLSERVEQVSQTRIAPRLTVRFQEIRSATDAEVGYLIVDVPPSPDAPHMVEGRYYGRGDKTKYVLADGEVRRIMGLSRDRRVRFRDRLAAEVERGPAPPHAPPEAHLFVVAAPSTGRPEMLHDALVRSGSSLRDWGQTTLLGGAPGAPPLWSPDAYNESDRSDPVRLEPSANGIGMYHHQTFAPRITDSEDDEDIWPSTLHLFRLEIDDDGTIHLFCGVVTEKGRDYSSTAERRVTRTPLVAGLMARVVRTAVEVSNAVTYTGSWDIGLQLTNLRGAISSPDGWNVGESPVAYSEDGYSAAGQFLVDELSRDEPTVVIRLCGRFYRGLGEDLTTWANLGGPLG